MAERFDVSMSAIIKIADRHHCVMSCYHINITIHFKMCFMKKFLFMFTSLLFVVVAVNAQDTLRDRDQTKKQAPIRDRIHQEDHLMLLDGKLYLVDDGDRTLVQNQLKLRNGGVANPDGSYQLQNQERMQLRNGECLDMDGNRYQNQQRFNQRHMMTQREIQRSQDKVMKQQQKQIKKAGKTGGRN